MSPASIAALRDFSAAVRHSPEPARSVADLALLLAQLAENDAAAPAAADPAPAAGTEPAAEVQPDPAAA